MCGMALTSGWVGEWVSGVVSCWGGGAGQKIKSPQYNQTRALFAAMTRDGVENGGRSRSSSDIGNDRMVSDAAPSIDTPDPAREDLAWLLMDMASSGHRNENTTTESRTRSFDDETVFDTEEGESEGSSLDPALAATRTYYKIRMAEAEAAATSLYPEDGSIQENSIGDSNDDDNGDDDGGGGDDDDYHDNSEAIRLAALTGRPGFRSTLSGDNDVWKTLSVTSLNAGDGPARGRDRGSSSGSSGDAQGRCNGPDDFDKWIPEALANSPKAVHWYKRWFDFMFNNHRKNVSARMYCISLMLLLLFLSSICIVFTTISLPCSCCSLARTPYSQQRKTHAAATHTSSLQFRSR